MNIKAKFEQNEEAAKIFTQALSVCDTCCKQEVIAAERTRSIGFLDCINSDCHWFVIDIDCELIPPIHATNAKSYIYIIFIYV